MVHQGIEEPRQEEDRPGVRVQFQRQRRHVPVTRGTGQAQGGHRATVQERGKPVPDLDLEGSSTRSSIHPHGRRVSRGLRRLLDISRRRLRHGRDGMRVHGKVTAGQIGGPDDRVRDEVQRGTPGSGAQLVRLLHVVKAEGLRLLSPLLR